MNKNRIKHIDARMVSSKSRKAFREGALRAMQLNGYVVVAENGWIIKKYKNGSIERIRQIEQAAFRVLKLD